MLMLRLRPSISSLVHSSIFRLHLQAKMRPWPKVILFGDSHTQRSFDPTSGHWGSLLTNHYQRVCDVIPRGFSGYNSAHCCLILDHLFSCFSANEIACVTILLGSNDSSDVAWPNGQHVPLEQYSKNLKHIVNYFDSKGISKKRLILMAPPNYFHEQWTKHCIKEGKPLPDEGRTKVGVYAQACAQVSEQEGVTFLNLYDILSSQPNSAEMFVDGLHFSIKGGQLLFEHLQPLITAKLEAFSGNSLSTMMQLPHWSEFDVNNLETSFFGKNVPQ